MQIKRRKKTPIVIQMEAVECGAAALGIILSYYGRYVSLEELRSKCGVSRNGVNAFDMVQAAKSYGLEAEGFRVEFDNLKEIECPVVLYWKFNHFVVLEKIDQDWAYINDPAFGYRKISLIELAKFYSGIVLEMKPGPDFHKEGHPPRLLTEVKSRLSYFKDAISYLFFIQLALVLVGIASPIFFQIFIDKILGQQSLEWKWEFLGFMAGVMVLSFILNWIQGFFVNKLIARLSIAYATSFFWHLIRLPISFFLQRLGGEILFRMSLNAQVASMLAGPFITSILNTLLTALYVIFMFQYDAVIASLGLAIGITNLTVLWIITKIRVSLYAKYQQEQARAIGSANDMLNHIETIKISRVGNFFFSHLAGLYTNAINSLQEISRVDVILSSVSNISQYLGSALLLSVGAWRVMHGVITVGMLIALQLFMSNFLKPLSQLLNFGTNFQTLKIDINRLNDVLRHSIDPLTDEKKSELPSDGNQIEFKDVSFGYNPLEAPYITNFDLILKKGEWKALVGRNGSGKSTIAKLACGLYRPWTGEVYIGKNKLAELSYQALLQVLGYVGQESLLFKGSIRDNLTLLNPTFTDQQLDQAVKEVCLFEEIQERPGGYQAEVIEDGRNFSGGQKQRLEIASALLNNPHILILDESTSTVDSAMEAKILNNLKDRGCGCLFITHRLKMLQECDEILVIDKGKVVQRGSHNDLKVAEGVYKSMLEQKEFFHE